MSKKVLAFDFGASSGRALLASFDGQKISTTDIHRFSNDPVKLGGTIYWDFLRLFYNIKLGIGKAVNLGNKDIVSMGIDTWGVDFGLLNSNGKLLENPVHYRDERTIGIKEKAFEKLSKEDIYNETGIQFMDLNTVFQLYSLVLNNEKLLEQANDMLFMPDLFNYFLTGNKACEYSISSTSSLLNANTGNWSNEIINNLNIPKRLFGNVVDSGTKIGTLLPQIANELGVKNFNVYAVAGHDTACAVAAIPAKKGENYAYLSSGTWSLLGLELDKPIINKQSFENNFTNEGGYLRKIRFLKNIIGLWLMQESRRQWNLEGNNLSFKDIDELTIKAKSMISFINPNYNKFNYHGDMPNKIREYCKMTNQIVPMEKGDISRCITESLALEYRKALEMLESLKGSKVDVIRIIGGGVKDELICQYTANATKKTVIAGPIEATALGNIAIQLIANGEFKNIDEARTAIRNSYPEKIYEPKDVSAWDDAYDRYTKILSYQI